MNDYLMLRQVPESPKQQYFRIFGNQKFHIAVRYKSEGKTYYRCLCGNIYCWEGSDVEAISQYLGDECMSCRHATSKKVYRKGTWVLEVRIRRAPV